MWDKNGVLYRECIVGNIIGKHYWGENKEIKSGTKHFSAGTKVYCAFIFSDAERILMLGKPRKSFRKIEIVLRREYIKNFRMEKVYSPQIITFIDKHSHGMGLPESFVQWIKDNFNNTHIEIQEENT